MAFDGKLKQTVAVISAQVVLHVFPGHWTRRADAQGAGDQRASPFGAVAIVIDALCLAEWLQEACLQAQGIQCAQHSQRRRGQGDPLIHRDQQQGTGLQAHTASSDLSASARRVISARVWLAI